MSYCRFNEGDVYVYESDQGIECCGCAFGGSKTFATPADTVAHLMEHRAAGHDVPQSAIDELQAEADQQST